MSKRFRLFPEQTEVQDPGLGAKYTKETKRIINTDGTFNVQKTGMGFSAISMYQELIKMSWKKFTLITVAFIFLINIGFSFIYLILGSEKIAGHIDGSGFHNFLESFFFSFQTFTTVGYGILAPGTDLVSFVSSVESMIGLMCFALATGLIYGRFSKPNAKILFSENSIIAPYQDGWGLMFRITNQRTSNIIKLKATVRAIITTKNDNGVYERKYYLIPLERNEIELFPISWTLVHPIDEKSLFHNITQADLNDMNIEILVLISGFDETFNQEVHTHYSYIGSEIVVGAKFVPAYKTGEDGIIRLHADDIGKFERVAYP